MVGSLTGVVASKKVTEASKGALRTIGNRSLRVFLRLFLPMIRYGLPSNLTTTNTTTNLDL